MGALQITCSGGISSALPVFCGIVSGFVYSFFSIMGAGFVDQPIMANQQREQKRRRARQQFFGEENAKLGRNRVPNANVNVNANNNNPAPTTANLIHPPSEEAIESLTSMGFDRQSVIRTLQQCDNNVEIAANRLLSE